MTKLAPTIMVQGTASSVGKSMVTTALCYLYRQAGLRVAPFKAQNMALNAYVCADGSEIGRAQAVQAEAAGVLPTALMNPILLKPESERRSQVIVMGKPLGSMAATAYHELKPELRSIIVDSLQTLRSTYDLVVIEGAGSPAEINLKQNDLVNMFVAKAVRSPVLLVGDIDRGGVFAAMVGTLALLEPEERELIAGFIINKFRGDLALLQPGLEFLTEYTKKPVFGVLPYIHRHGIPEEDSLGLETRRQSRPAAADRLRIAVLRLPRISNYDEFVDLETEPGVYLDFVEDPGIRLDHDLVIVPGSKNTLTDLDWLRATGFAEQLFERLRREQPLIGICGGYQMLGHQLDDSAGVENEPRTGNGLGLLPIDTKFYHAKSTAQLQVKLSPGVEIHNVLAASDILSGYEIHCGQVSFRKPAADEQIGIFTVLDAGDRCDGASARGGLVWGSLVHGLWQQQSARSALVDALWQRRGGRPDVLKVAAQALSPDERFANLGRAIQPHLDWAALDQCIFGRAVLR